MIIKREIDKLRNAVFTPSEPQGFGGNQDPYQSYKSKPKYYDDDRPINVKHPPPGINDGGYSAGGGGELENNSSIVNKTHQKYGGDDTKDRIPIKQPTYNQSKTEKMYEDQQDTGQERSTRIDTFKPHDEQVLPAILKGKRGDNPFHSGPGGEGEDGLDRPKFEGEAEEIHPDNLGNAEP